MPKVLSLQKNKKNNITCVVSGSETGLRRRSDTGGVQSKMRQVNKMAKTCLIWHSSGRPDKLTQKRKHTYVVQIHK